MWGIIIYNCYYFPSLCLGSRCTPFSFEELEPNPHQVLPSRGLARVTESSRAPTQRHKGYSREEEVKIFDVVPRLWVQEQRCQSPEEMEAPCSLSPSTKSPPSPSSGCHVQELTLAPQEHAPTGPPLQGVNRCRRPLGAGIQCQTAPSPPPPVHPVDLWIQRKERPRFRPSAFIFFPAY